MEVEKTEEINTTSPPSHHQELTDHRGIKALPFIIGNEAFEKLGSIGTQANLTVYLITVFNMKKITAALLLSIFQGTANVAPLFGALLSDSYFGRYKTLAFTSFSSLLGMIVLTLTAAIPQLHPPKCESKSGESCAGATGWQLGFLLSGFGFIILGAAGIRPCSLAFGIDQFNQDTESGKKSVQTLFNWYYFTTTISIMISATFIVYVQSNVSWAIGMAIPASLVFFSCVLFFCGSKIYVKVAPQGSPLASIAQVLVAAFKKRNLTLPENPNLSLFRHVPPCSTNSKLPYTSQFNWLAKSAIVTSQDRVNQDGSAANKWNLCSIQQVEEAKCILRVIPIWASGIFFNVAMSPQFTYVPYQSLQSDRRIGNKGFQIPPGSFVVFTMLSLTLWIPIYDRLVIPLLKKLRYQNGFTLLQRMGIGIFLSVLTMIISGFVEERRKVIAVTEPTLGISEKGGEISAMSAFWLVPQLAVAGLSEAFNTIGQIEFYYKEFPENMKSIGGSFLCLGFAMSSYLNGFLIATVHRMTERSSKGGDWLPEDLNKGKLDWFYYMIAGLGVVNFGYFLVFARWYKYRGCNASEVGMEEGSVI